MNEEKKTKKVRTSEEIKQFNMIFDGKIDQLVKEIGLEKTRKILEEINNVAENCEVAVLRTGELVTVEAVETAVKVLYHAGDDYLESRCQTAPAFLIKSVIPHLAIPASNRFYENLFIYVLDRSQELTCEEKEVWRQCDLLSPEGEINPSYEPILKAMADVSYGGYLKILDPYHPSFQPSYRKERIEKEKNKGVLKWVKRKISSVRTHRPSERKNTQGKGIKNP